MTSPIMALQQVGTQQVGYWMSCPTGTSTSGEDETSKAARVEGGEISASGDDAPAKVRKPYTITKQRERWTEDEHQKFLEALKLYGRAWRRIEEHIGSKTTVQIRSHAQKFFSKLERKASVGSLPVTGGSQDIEIPPPRPKRKPSHPYPRKAGGAFSISSSFEEDSKLPQAVCSGFTSLESPTLNMWKAPLKNMSQTTFPTLSRQLSLQPFSLQEVSHEAQQKAGSSSSLRLFGQTVVVPRSDSCALDTEHQIEPSDSICLESESTGSPRSEVSMEVDEDSGILSSRCSTKEDGAQEKSAVICQPHGAVGASSDNGSSEALSHGAQEKSAFICQPHGAVGANSDNGSSEALVCDTNEKVQTCENNLELSKEIQEAAQKGQKLNVDLSCHLDRLNDSTISNMTSTNSIPLKSPLLSSPHRLSVHQHASQSCEGVSPLTLPNFSGSCFTPWHPSREAKQHPGLFPASVTAFLPSLPPEHFFQRSNEDASSAAASFAVAPAWQVIGGAIPAAIGHPNMGMVYSPVAILAASTEPAFGPATHFFGSFSPLEQATNTHLTSKRERGQLGDIHKHSAGSEDENELTEMQVEDDNFAVISTDEGYCSPPDTCAISCESSCDRVDGVAWKKRNRMSYGDKMHTGTEVCKSLLRTHSTSCDPLVSESERSENVNVILFSETDREIVQHGCNDNVIVDISNSLSIEASSVNSRKSEECDDKKQETGCAQMMQSSRQIEASPVEGLQLSEVYDVQNVPINKDENAEKQIALLDEATLVWEGVCPSGTGDRSLLSADDEGGIQLKDEQQCSALIEESESLPSGSKLGTEKREITSSEQSGKNISEVNNGNGVTVHVGAHGGDTETAHGGDTETEMCIGKHQFVKIGKLTSASRYSGVGFVPYKRASGEVKVPGNTIS